MPVISRFFGIIIAIYWRDHAPPHFHAKYGGQEAAVDIRNGKVLKGMLSKRARKLVEEWRGLRRNELMQDWELAGEGKPLHYISPLE
ncbi:MAG: DUF4160 domain-containing protein [Elusimicrobia bacterium]|nr:DUF4160 domain-containing protein [Elusimicrobiota bacterium]